MALPLPSSLACSRFKPKGICGFGNPLPYDLDMEMKGGNNCFVVFRAP